jgi:hypothetical protein
MAKTELVVNIEVAGKQFTLKQDEAKELYEALGKFFGGRNLDVTLDEQNTQSLLEKILKEIEDAKSNKKEVIYIPWWTYDKWPWYNGTGTGGDYTPGPTITWRNTSGQNTSQGSSYLDQFNTSGNVSVSFSARSID